MKKKGGCHWPPPNYVPPKPPEQRLEVFRELLGQFGTTQPAMARGMIVSKWLNRYMKAVENAPS